MLAPYLMFYCSVKVFKKFKLRKQWEKTKTIQVGLYEGGELNIISFPISACCDLWVTSPSLTGSVVGGSRSGANFCLSYLLTMVYLRNTRSGHTDIVAISWRAHSNSLIFTTLCHIPTKHTSNRCTVSSFLYLLAAAQYSSPGFGSPTLRVSPRVSGSGSGSGPGKTS